MVSADHDKVDGLYPIVKSLYPYGFSMAKFFCYSCPQKSRQNYWFCGYMIKNLYKKVESYLPTLISTSKYLNFSENR